jgi:hypothetical protein
MNELDKAFERDALIIKARYMLSTATLWSPNNDVLEGIAAVIRRIRVVDANDTRHQELIQDLNKMWSRASTPGHYRFVPLAKMYRQY